MSEPLLEYHTAFILCASCGSAVPLPILANPSRGFQIKLPEDWDLRRYHLGVSELWAICGSCRKEESALAPTCIACGQSMHGHEPTCRSLTERKPS